MSCVSKTVYETLAPFKVSVSSVHKICTLLSIKWMSVDIKNISIFTRGSHQGRHTCSCLTPSDDWDCPLGDKCAETFALSWQFKSTLLCSALSQKGLQSRLFRSISSALLLLILSRFVSLFSHSASTLADRAGDRSSASGGDRLKSAAIARDKSTMLHS